MPRLARRRSLPRRRRRMVTPVVDAKLHRRCPAAPEAKENGVNCCRRWRSGETGRCDLATVVVAAVGILRCSCSETPYKGTKFAGELSSAGGEVSNVDDALWLTSRAYYKPIVECCDGTDLASTYVAGSLLQPQAFGTFSSASMSVDFVILDEDGHAYPNDKACIGVITSLKFSSGDSF
nr:probable acyl-activating enzyme 18, peroxisomal [Ipomoea trifida]